MVFGGFATEMQFFQTGYRKNPRRRAPRDWGKSTLDSRPRAPGTATTLAHLAPPIFDQGDTGSCVGHARARGLYVARRAQGAALPFIPSPATLYKLALCYERRDWNGTLLDEGCDPVDTVDALRQWGVGPMVPLEGRYSDADPDTIGQPPDLAQLIAGFSFRFVDDYQIGMRGLDRTLAICDCLDRGFPVCIDVSASPSWFQNYEGGILRQVTPAALDHYVCLLGYQVAQSGEVLFDGHNSWGTFWGNAGTFQIGDDVIQHAGDILVSVEHTP